MKDSGRAGGGAMGRLMRSAAFMIALGAIAGSARLVEPIAEEKADVEIAYLPTSGFARMASMGYNELAADIYWFKAVQYYGGFRLSRNDIRLFTDLADMITDLDPHFTGAYRLSALVITEDLGEFDEAVRLMEKGLRANPEDYWLTFEMGFLHYLDGRDYLEAEKYFRIADGLPGSDGRAARFAAEAASKGGNIEASIRLWKELAEASDNEYMRDMADRYIEKLKARLDSGRCEEDI